MTKTVIQEEHQVVISCSREILRHKYVMDRLLRLIVEVFEQQG